MSDEPVVQINDLTKQYGEFTALNGLSLQLERGRILGFIGPNGAGKTTTIKILVGLLRPTSGSASIAGFDCTRDAKKIKQVVGYMPDYVGTYDNMRVHEYLDFFGAAFNIPRKVRGARLEEVMQITGSYYMRDMFVESLSHGMRKRVGIARTLLHDPQVLIMDEPASGLDPKARIEIRQLLADLAQRGKTLIVSSHILPELSRICDVVAIIASGQLRAFGSLDQIMAQVRQRRVMEVQLTSGAKDRLDKAVQLINEHISDVTEVAISKSEQIVRFSTNCDDQMLVGLIGAIAVAEIGMVQFREVPMDLEDAFLKVTGAATSAAPSNEPDHE